MSDKQIPLKQAFKTPFDRFKEFLNQKRLEDFGFPKKLV